MMRAHARLIPWIGTFAAVFLHSLEVAAADAGDPLAPYNTDDPPRIVATLETFQTNEVEVTRLRFESKPVATSNGVENVEIFASLCRPGRNLRSQVSDSKLPALLVLHGGGGNAEERRAIGWARRGYVALASELPGIGSPEKLQSLGPFRREKYGAGHFRVINGDVTTCGIFDAVVAGLKGLALLRSQPDVDRSRVGIVGVSWGGYMTTMLCGLAGRRVDAAFSVYGCGYYDRGSSGGNNLEKLGDPVARDAWLRWLDAGRRAKGIRCPIFFAAAADDFFFFPPAVMATYEDISSPKNLVFAPNVSHAINLPGGTRGWNNDTWVDMEVPWFDRHLRGNGAEFPAMTATEARREGDGIRVGFAVTRAATITNTAVWYTADAAPWPKKQWLQRATERNSALLPVTNAAQAIHWFAVASDARPVTVSTPLQTVDPRTLGFASEAGPATP